VRALFISNVVPWPLAAGDKIRAYHLLRAVATVTDLTLVSFAYNEDERQDLDALAPLVRESFLLSRETCRYRREARLPRRRRILAGLRTALHPGRPALIDSWNSSVAEQLVQHLAQRRFDIVIAEWLGALPLLRWFEGARRFVNMNDIEHRKLAHRLTRIRPDRLALLDCLEYMKLRRFERRLTRLPYEFLVCSDVDRHALGGGPHVWVVPNGADPLPELPPPAPDGSGCTLLFVGEMSYSPNVDAVTFFVRRVLPIIRQHIPSARFLVIGSNPVPAVRALEDGRAVTVTGPVTSVRPYLENARLVVVPIRYGAGTRLKILEAMGHGRAVVSTTIGAEGLDVRHDEHLLIADEPSAFAQACIRLARDRQLRQRLTGAAYHFVTTRYDWNLIERSLQEIVLGRSEALRTTDCYVR
jgi:glycosyltransferase involved in cell wall biosynthesis